MRKIVLMLVIGLGILIQSCTPNYSDAFAEGELRLSKDKLIFDTRAKETTIAVMKSNTWRIDTTGIAQWCKLTAIYDHNGGDYVTVAVEENTAIESRSTSFKIVSDFDSKVITVDQMGHQPTILFNKADTLYFGLHNTYVDIELVSNIKFDINIEFETESPNKWLTLTKAYVSDEHPIRVTLEKNEEGRQRRGKVVFTQKDGEYKTEIVFVQSNTTIDYVQGDITDIDGNHKLVISAAHASSEIDGRDISKSYDGNDITHYHSAWQLLTDPIVLEYDFENEEVLNYLVYTPSSSDPNKNFADTEIWTTSRGEQPVKQKTHLFAGETRQIVMFDEPVKNPVKVKIVVKKVAGNNLPDHMKPQDYKNNVVATCAEIGFYSAVLNYDNIFTDKSYSAIKPGVTMTDIFAIKDEFYRNIAQFLYNKEYPMIRINNYENYPVPNNGPQAYGMNMSPGMLDNVTGISVKQNDEIIVMVDNASPEVKLGLLNPNERFMVADYTINDGVNKLKMNKDGLLYVKFHTDNARKNVTVHIAGGEINGFFDIQRHTDDQGLAMLRSAKSTYFDLLGKHVHLILPTQALRQNTSSLKALVQQYDNILEMYHNFIGLDENFHPIKNRICIKTQAGGGEGNNVVILTEDNIAKLTTLGQLRGDALWELAQKLSRVYTLSSFIWTPALLDIAAIHVQREIEGKTKLLTEGYYETAFKKFLIEEEAFESRILTEDLNRVVPLWQIYLYMTEIVGDKDFYKNLHNTSLTAYTKAAFVKNVNDVSKYNFNNFLKSWCFAASGTTQTGVVPSGVNYLTETNIELFKAPKAVVPGIALITKADAATDRAVRIFNTKNAVAFEVIYNSYINTVSLSDQFVIKNYKSSMKIVAVDADGVRTELPKSGN